ncbi:hypothetical protein FPV67DRAFT_1481268 [Lyophyllum atratum]|nr:hypothetical protein FPV67DRAFT_1481268 [Lyophyllum atratum]
MEPNDSTDSKPHLQPQDERIAAQLDGLLNVPILPEELEAYVKSEFQRHTIGLRGSSTPDHAVISQATSLAAHLQHGEFSDTESNLLSSAMDQILDDISDNKQDILRLQLQANTILRDIERLKVKEAQMQKQWDFFRSHRSTLRRLPAEVLAHIFSYHLDETITPSFQSTLLSIVQVCRSWRRAGLGYANQWKSLSIDSSGVNRWGPLVQHLPGWWFSNAKDFPLSFSLTAPEINVVSPVSSSTLFDLFIPFSHRLSGLHLQLQECEALTAFFCLPRDMFPSLQTLSLICRDYGSGPKSTELFSSAPHLRNVVLNVTPVNISGPSDFVFPWNQLTSLDILQSLNFDEWLVIFCQCVHLEVGRFTIRTTHDSSVPAISQHVTFEHLATLAISFWYNDWEIGTLSYFHFPALRELCLIANEGSNAPVDRFLRTFRASPLKILSLAYVRIKVKYLVLFLNSCNSLEELMIGFPMLSFGDDELYQDKVFEAIRKGVGKTISRPTLPNLKSFSACVFAEVQEYDFGRACVSVRPVTQLAALLRWWSVRPEHFGQLESVTIYAHAPNEGENGRVAEYFLKNLRSHLKGCTYDEVHHPAGFNLETTSLDSEDVYESDLFGAWPTGCQPII